MANENAVLVAMLRGELNTEEAVNDALRSLGASVQGDTPKAKKEPAEKKEPAKK